MQVSTLNQAMGVIIIHNNASDDGKDSLLRFAVCTEPLANIVFDRMDDSVSCFRNYNNIIAIPHSWATKPPRTRLDVMYYKENLNLASNTNGRLRAHSWVIILDGRFVTKINYNWLYKVLAQLQADVIAVNVLPQLRAFYEKVLVTSQSNIIGFRRFYGNSARPTMVPNDWPHCLFIKTNVFDRVLVNGILTLAFSQFIRNCSSNLLVVQGLDVGGALWDLNTEEGLIDLLRAKLKPAAKSKRQSPDEETIEISDSAKLFGEVMLGQNISIGHKAIIIGPTIISNNVKIEKGSVVRTSIIGPDVLIPSNSFIRNRVLLGSHNYSGQSGQNSIMESVKCGTIGKFGEDMNNFRTWPRFSYGTFFKRIIDVFVAIIVLVLFVPIIPIIALVIKLNSPGSVFFKDKRQGLHGKIFNCLKFRTMVVGADKIQDRFRVLNQVDGPQFRIEYDPRVDTVGRFLRDTYIDEIPQFVNVLLGQMSIVGPRPSPESENTLCPSWHDARLSVRPGITGLWQVCRTRQPMKDFQEWIYYDIKYVKNLSLKMDMWIFWQTVKKTLENFINQF
jgi:lipopolysaccharide/colanic/teichoic acid biosynthesis glycosyltransferase/NDP-sugar pyrophosphorylase family protein